MLESRVWPLELGIVKPSSKFIPEMDPMKPPQIPGYTAPPPKKAKKSKSVDRVITAESGQSTAVSSSDIVENDSVFVSRLLGPLDGSIVESPPTPAPVYSSGNYWVNIVVTHNFVRSDFNDSAASSQQETSSQPESTASQSEVLSSLVLEQPEPLSVTCEPIAAASASFHQGSEGNSSPNQDQGVGQPMVSILFVLIPH